MVFVDRTRPVRSYICSMADCSAEVQFWLQIRTALLIHGGRQCTVRLDDTETNTAQVITSWLTKIHTPTVSTETPSTPSSTSPAAASPSGSPPPARADGEVPSTPRMSATSEVVDPHPATGSLAEIARSHSL